jgi:hypothetical protein
MNDQRLILDDGPPSLTDPERPPCEGCGEPASIRCVALDSPPGEPEESRTILLCYWHFWDWNAWSLKRRGLDLEAASFWHAINKGSLTHAPPRTLRLLVGNGPFRRHDPNDVEVYPREMFE